MDLPHDLGAGIARIELGDHLDGVCPARHFRRHFDRVAMILIDARDGFAQRTLECRVVRQVLANAVGHARELALDDALLRFPARRQQHFAIAAGEPHLAIRDGLRGQAQASRQSRHGIVDRLMCRATREIQRADEQNGQQRGGDRPAKE